MIAVSYIIKRKIKKIFIEIISNSKILNIIFFNKIINDQDFHKLTGGLDKGGTGQRRIRYLWRFQCGVQDKERTPSWSKETLLWIKQLRIESGISNIEFPDINFYVDKLNFQIGQHKDD